MAEDFNQRLSNIAASNPMGGLLLSAQASLIKDQTMATKQVVNSFSQRLQELESQPLTVEEQMQRLNEDPDISQSFDTLTSQIGDYQSLTMSIMKREEELGRIYGESLNALAYVGGDTAGRVSESLKGDLATKKADLQRLADAPFQTLQYKKVALDIINMQFDTKTKEHNLQELRESHEGTMLFNEMVKDETFSAMLLDRDEATGNRKFSLNDFFRHAYLKFGDKEHFARGWVAMDEYIRKHTVGFKAHAPRISSDRGSLLQHDENGMLLYNWMKAETEKFNRIKTHNPLYDLERKAYEDAAFELYGAMPEDPTFQYTTEAKKYRFGYDKAVIEAMDGTAKDLAQDIHDVWYNPDSDVSYAKTLGQFSHLLGRKVRGDDIDQQGNITDPITGFKYPIFNSIATVDDTDFNNYINAGDPEGVIDYKRIEAEFVKDEQAKKDKKKEEERKKKANANDKQFRLR